MAYDLGTVKGSVNIDIAQAVASYAALRRTNAATNTALLESSRTLKTVGAGLVGIGAVALAGFGLAVKAAADFQAQMRYFQVVTGSSKGDMQDATKEAFKLAQTSGYTAGEIAGAFVELGKAGINAKQLVAGVAGAVAQLGAAAQIPLKDSAEIIVNTMKTFQLGAGQATTIANQLAGAANASTIDITDLAYSLRYVGGTAASLGVPLHDVLDALGQLGNAGVRGSTGGTALRKILLQLAPTTKQAVAELEKLNIIQTNGGVSADKYSKLQGKQKAAIDVLRKAQEKLIEVEKVQQANAAGGGSGGAAAAARQEAAANRLRSANERLTASEKHLQEVQQKYASSPLGNTAAKQAAALAALQAAQDRVTSAQQHLTDTQKKNAEIAASSSGKSGAAAHLKAAFQLRQAQDAVTAAANKARQAGVAVAPGIEKMTNLFFDATGKAKPLSQVFQILQDHMKGMTQQQKVQALNLIFGNRAISSALILTREGAKGFKEFGKQMDQTSAADVMRKRLDTLAGSWKIFKGAMSVALIQAGAPAQTPLKILVQTLTSIVKIFINLPKPLQTALSAFVLLFGVLTAGVGTFILLVGFIGRAVKAWREFKAALAFIKEIQLVQRAIALLNITMLANPVVLVIAAIVALIVILAVLIIKVKPVRDFFIAMGRDIVGAFWAVIRFFERLPGYFVTAWNKIKAIFWDGVHLIEKYWWLLPGIFLGPIAGIIAIIIHFRSQILGALEAMANGIVSFFEKLPGRIITGLVAVLKFLAGLPDQIAYWLGFIIGRFIRFGIDGAKAFASFAKNAFWAIVNFFKALPGTLWNLLVQLWKLEVKGWTNIYNGIIGLAKRIYHDVVHFFELLPGRVWGFLKELWKQEVRGWTNIYNDVISIVKRLFHDVVNFFEQLPSNLWKFLKAMVSDLKKVADDMYNGAITISENIANGILAFVENLPDLVYQALLNVIKSIGKLAGKAFDSAKHWGNQLWSGFKKGLFGSPRTKIEYALEDMTATADRETKKLAQQVRYLNGLATRIPNGQLLGQSTGAHRVATAPIGVAGAAGQVIKNYNVTNNYPKPEPASDGVERVLNNLEFVGALG